MRLWSLFDLSTSSTQSRLLPVVRVKFSNTLVTRVWATNSSTFGTRAISLQNDAHGRRSQQLLRAFGRDFSFSTVRIRSVVVYSQNPDTHLISALLSRCWCYELLPFIDNASKHLRGLALDKVVELRGVVFVPSGEGWSILDDIVDVPLHTSQVDFAWRLVVWTKNVE